MKEVLVYGSGMSAIANSIVAHSKGYRVDMLDTKGTFASGWGSDDIYLDGNSFRLDKGIRIPTSINNIFDEYLYNDDCYKSVDWFKANSFMSEAVLHSKFSNFSSSCLDIKSLGIDLHNLNSFFRQDQILANNEEERLTQEYGKEITKRVFEDISVKRFGLTLSEIPPYAMKGLVPKRFILGDKKIIENKFGINSQINSIAAHQDISSISLSDTKKIYYPKNITIDSWIELLKTNLILKGINIDLNFGDIRSITKLGRGYQVLFTNGAKKDYEKILWSKPFIFLLKKLGLNEIVRSEELNFRIFRTMHLLMNGKVLHKKQYLLNFQDPWNLHRVIFWQNLQFKSISKNIITLELQYISGQDESFIDLDLIISKLKKNGLLNTDSMIQDFKLVQTKTMIPILLTKHHAKIFEYQCQIKEKFPNLYFPNSDGIRFLDELFQDAMGFFE